jgi:hypothetical protein
MWREIGGNVAAREVLPSKLRDLRLYGGQQGIWVDKKRTRELTDDGYGVAVSVLHKGDIYPDDFSETGVIYHYPSTDRPRSRDIGEIEAVKNCRRHDLPIFVIRINPEDSGLRDVFWGNVTYWNDESEAFIIEFGRRPDSLRTNSAFQVRESADQKYETGVYARDAGFRIAVLSRYGTQCAVCGIKVVDLLDAAHLVPKSERGSDDPRNGLVLCSLHHRALDRGYFAINPETLTIVRKPKGPSFEKINVSRQSISHLSSLPHQEALAVAWELWIERTGLDP